MLVSNFMSNLILSFLCTIVVLFPIYYFAYNKNKFLKQIMTVLYVKQFCLLSENIDLVYDLCFSFLAKENVEEQSYFKGHLIQLNILGTLSKNGYVIIMKDVFHTNETAFRIPIIIIYNMKNPDNPFIKLEKSYTEYNREVKDFLFNFATWYNVKELRKFNRLIKKNIYYKNSIHIKNILVNGAWGKDEMDINYKLFNKLIYKMKKDFEFLQNDIDKNIEKSEVDNAEGGTQ